MNKPTTFDPATLERHVEASAALIRLPIPPEYRDGVVRYFGIAAGMAELVMDMPLGAEDEPAAVFVPVEPDRRVPAGPADGAPAAAAPESTRASCASDAGGGTQ